MKAATRAALSLALEQAGDDRSAVDVRHRGHDSFTREALAEDPLGQVRLPASTRPSTTPLAL